MLVTTASSPLNSVRFFCDVDYDVFRYMSDNEKTYGFTINIFDSAASLPSLWPETMQFLASHPDSLAVDNSMDWLTDATLRPEHNMNANGYSTCHFWSNFEIADLRLAFLPLFYFATSNVVLCSAAIQPQGKCRTNMLTGSNSFWRSDIYQQYFDHLDKSGGFFYERWGDAPVHSIALGLFESAKKIHW